MQIEELSRMALELARSRIDRIRYEKENKAILMAHETNKQRVKQQEAAMRELALRWYEETGDREGSDICPIRKMEMHDYNSEFVRGVLQGRSDLFDIWGVVPEVDDDKALYTRLIGVLLEHAPDLVRIQTTKLESARKAGRLGELSRLVKPDVSYKDTPFLSSKTGHLVMLDGISEDDEP